MNTPFNIIHSPILTNRRMAGQYHYLWTGQYDKKMEYHVMYRRPIARRL